LKFISSGSETKQVKFYLIQKWTEKEFIVNIKIKNDRLTNEKEKQKLGKWKA
jgi:hypothetical protein